MYTNQSRDVFTTIGLGFRASKAAAALPQGTTQDIFVVSGGNVLVTLLYGMVGTVLGAVANNLSVNSNPTAAGTTYIIASAIEGNALEANSFLVVEGDGTALMITGKAGAGPVISGIGRWICPVGTITFECVGSTTGTTSWEIFYVPLSEGAQVVTA
jgi:hypothetical protein